MISFAFFRRLFYEIHLWSGMISGLLLTIICLSGAIYTFRTECRHLAEPSKFYVASSPGRRPLSVDRLIDSLENRHEMRVAHLTIPQAANRSWVFYLVRDQGSAAYSDRLCYLNPYTGETVGEGGTVVDSFFQSVRRLHRFLWLPPHIGRPVVGWTTVVFIVVSLSGLILWLPRSRKHFSNGKAWRIGFRVRFGRGFHPLLYDLHNTLGFYTLIPMLLLALTGLCWSFPVYRDTASRWLGARIFQQYQPTASIEGSMGKATPHSVGEIIRRHNALLPGPGELTVNIPADPSTALTIQKGLTGFFAFALKNRVQWDRTRGTVVPIEHYGKIVAVERFSDKPFGAKIASSVRAIHFGEITGFSSKIVFFTACLLASSFPATGFWLWLKKWRAFHRRNSGVGS